MGEYFIYLLRHLHKDSWKRHENTPFLTKYSVADPDLQIKGGGGRSYRPWDKGGPNPPGPSTGSATGISHQTAPSQIQYKNSSHSASGETWDKNKKNRTESYNI